MCCDQTLGWKACIATKMIKINDDWSRALEFRKKLFYLLLWKLFKNDEK